MTRVGMGVVGVCHLRLMLSWQFEAYLSWKGKIMGEENKKQESAHSLRQPNTPVTGAAVLGW